MWIKRISISIRKWIRSNLSSIISFLLILLFILLLFILIILNLTWNYWRLNMCYLWRLLLTLSNWRCWLRKIREWRNWRMNFSIWRRWSWGWWLRRWRCSMWITWLLLLLLRRLLLWLILFRCEYLLRWRWMKLRIYIEWRLCMSKWSWFRTRNVIR